VAAARPEDIECDWWDVTQVIGVIERRLDDHYVPTRRLMPITFFAEWDLAAK
jgi:hypothetical protein